MPLHLGLSLEMVYPSQKVKSFSWPFLASIQHVRFHPTSFCWKYREPIIWRTPDSFASLDYVRLHNLRSIVCVGKIYNKCQPHCTKISSSHFKAQSTGEDTEVESLSDSCGSLSDRNRKEEERRRKIGLANKGRVPWNKGKKHTEETRTRIKQRTIEALRNPEVRKKMSEHPQPHSDETKEKIRSSVKRVWAKRAKWKRSKEKFISAWSENIAEAAKKGGRGQIELDWDSYDRRKEEILREQLQLDAEKARAKEQAKLRAQKAAEARAEKMKRLAERKKEREQKMIREAEGGHSEHNKKATIASRLKLKQRLTKIQKKKPKLGRVAIEKDRVDSAVPRWEKLDFELIKKERTGREFSLADQIQAAKSRRTVLYQHWPQA